MDFLAREFGDVACRVYIVAVHGAESVEPLGELILERCRIHGAGRHAQRRCHHAPVVEDEVSSAFRAVVQEVAFCGIDLRRSDGHTDLVSLLRGVAPLIVDADLDGVIAARRIPARAVPAVVEVTEIPREVAHGHDALRCGINDVVVNAATVDHHRFAVTAILQQRLVGGIDGIRAAQLLIAAAAPAHRVSYAALRIRERGAEHTAAARLEGDVDEVGQARCARVAVHLECELCALTRAVVIHLAGLLIVGDVDGDLRHHEVHRIAVHEARKTHGAVHAVAIADLCKPALVALAVSVAVLKEVVHDVVGCVVDGARIPHDGNGVRMSIIIITLAHKINTCLLGQMRDEEIRIERTFADLGIGIRPIHRSRLAAHVGDFDGEFVDRHGVLAHGRQQGIIRQSVRLQQLEHTLPRIGAVARGQVARVDGQHICLHQISFVSAVVAAVLDHDIGDKITIIIDAIQCLAVTHIFLGIDHKFDRLNAGSNFSAVCTITIHVRLGGKIDIDVKRWIGRVVIIGEGGQQRRNQDCQVAKGVFRAFYRIKQCAICLPRSFQ